MFPTDYGFPPGQSQYGPNQASHPQHPPPPYQRSNFPQYPQPFGQQQQQQPGAQQGMQKPNSGISRTQYLQDYMMRKQQQQQQQQLQQQQQQMQQHYKQQYAGQYGVRCTLFYLLF